MNGQRVVVALGGHALAGDSEQARRTNLATTAAEIAELVRIGHAVTVTHGNGPQVGQLLLDQEARRQHPTDDRREGLDVLVAMTQAQLGYALQREIGAALQVRGLPRDVASLITQVRVASDDPAFSRPSKPVGPSHREPPWDGHAYAKTPAGQWRRVVPSPRPLELVEAAAIQTLSEANSVLICAGGGGIPVVMRDGRLTGVDAVIDKDHVSEMVAKVTGADALLILTDVANVQLDYGTPAARAADSLTVAEVDALLASGEVDAGSMGPKLQAAASAARRGRFAAIGALGQAAEILAGEAGTRIVC